MSKAKYNSSIFVAVPTTKLPIAAPIARAFDPDFGGDKSFDTLRATDINGDTYAICMTPAVADFAKGIPLFQTVPGALSYYVDLDYEARWGDMPKPTLQECEDFRTSIMLSIGNSLDGALTEFGLTLVPEA